MTMSEIPISLEMNEHLIGVGMKEIVRRVIETVRKLKLMHDFTVHDKDSDYKDSADFFTTADIAAQQLYVKLLQEFFPGFGIIAEEDELSIPCSIPEIDIYFTVDPIDGTKALIRNQSHAISTMLALVCNGVVIAVWIGDIMTREIYGFRPGSDKTHRIMEYETSILLKPERKPLEKSYVLFTGNIDRLDGISRHLARSLKNSGLFEGHEVMRGSIGTNMARLWKGEVAAVILGPFAETPWDSTPIIGISKRLGFIFLRDNGDELTEYDPEIPKSTGKREHATIIVHPYNLDELLNWTAQLQ